MKQIKKLIIANWKMNPPSLREAREIFKGTEKIARALRHVETVICPPFVYLSPLRERYTGKTVSFGAQNCHSEEKGAYTGEIAPAMLASLGARFVLVGHSERRALGETDGEVNRKMNAALRQNLYPVLCIGESERDMDGGYLEFLSHQILVALEGVNRKHLSRLTIAYEPLWAIGHEGASAMAPRDLHETTIYIRKILRDKYKTDVIFAIPILYGGSVAPENTATLLRDGNIQGLLVGHQSLKPKVFGKILQEANLI